MVRVLGILSASLLVLSACGGGGAAPAAAPAGGAGGGGSAVTVEGFKFSPQSLEVTVGTKVVWTNKDGASHTTTSGRATTKDGKWDGTLAGSGGNFSFTFAQAGTFPYFCDIHGSAMTGTVVVK